MDKYEKLKSLHQLLKEGVLSEEEYAVEKAKLMGKTSMTINEMYASGSAPNNSEQRSSQPASYQGPAIHKTIVYAQPSETRRANGVAITGFIFTLIGTIPYIGLLFNPIGIILCFIGVAMNGRKYKRGLAIAGLIIGLVTLIVWFLVIFVFYNYSHGRYFEFFKLKP